MIQVLVRFVDYANEVFQNWAIDFWNVLRTVEKAKVEASTPVRIHLSATEKFKDLITRRILALVFVSNADTSSMKKFVYFIYQAKQKLFHLNAFIKNSQMKNSLKDISWNEVMSNLSAVAFLHDTLFLASFKVEKSLRALYGYQAQQQLQ